MSRQIDYGEEHECKISEKGLSCPPLSGYNHLAVFIRWAYEHDMLSDMLFDCDKNIKFELENNGDIRQAIKDSTVMRGKINSVHFKEEYRPFVEYYYKFNRHGYPNDVDENALNYFGKENYNCDEFKNEAYLFVPYDEEYYKNLSAFIEKAWQNRSPRLTGQSIGKDKLDRIIELVKEKTAQEKVAITIERGNTTITSSKIGGYPYWTKEKEYPVDETGKKLYLLAQFNCKDINHEKLPDHGILQFFIDRDTDLGLSVKGGYRVVYHETIDESITEDAVKAMGIPANTEVEDDQTGEGDWSWLPTQICYPLSFEKTTDYLDDNYWEFRDLVTNIINADLEIDTKGEKYSYFLCEEDRIYLRSMLADSHHKIFGIPLFTQSDPRDTDELQKKYDTLLFQLDSEYDNEEDGYDILIGDAGVINFFINHEDLEKLNFEDVLYNWDCS